MVDFHCREGVLPPIPTDISIPQFILDSPTAIKHASTTYLIEDVTGRKIGLEELRSRTFGLANALVSRYNISENDVVCVFSRNHVDYPVAIWAILRLGAIASGANPEYSSGELSYQIEIAEATLIIAHPDSLEIAVEAAKVRGLSRDRIAAFDVAGARHDFVTIESLVQAGLKAPPTFIEPKIDATKKIAFLSFSSGTTGKPKAVAIPHIAPITNAIQVAVLNKVGQNYTAWEEQRYRAGDICIAVLPFYHIYGLVVNLHFILHCGMSLVVVPKFNFVGMLNSVVRHRITHLMIVPPQAVLLVKHPAVKNYDLSVIRGVMIGAAPLSNEVHNQLIQLLPNAHIGQGYGMTETSTVISSWSTRNKRGVPGSAGQLIPGVTARVVKPDGSLAGYDELGELWVRTPASALCYYKNEKATQETFVDGWVRTGDEVKIDKDGEMWIVDRIKEIIKVRGFQVSPAELEGACLAHPAVSDVCIVGVPDDFSGEVPMAFIVLSADAQKQVERDPATGEAIKASVIKHIADNKVKYKHLAGGIEIVPVIPKNPSGKLLRRVLRDQAKELYVKKHKSKAKL